MTILAAFLRKRVARLTLSVIIVASRQRLTAI
jgi:hypothetical protein